VHVVNREEVDYLDAAGQCPDCEKDSGTCGTNSWEGAIPQMELDE
jgi:hypothetical protein